MSDLLHDDLNCVQSDKNAQPNTIASAATISPTHRFTRITGNTPITKINPPVTGYHELVFVWTTGTSGAFATGGTGAGAMGVAFTTVANLPVLLCYDPRTQLYYPLGNA